MFVVGAVLGVLATGYLAVAGPNVGIHLQGNHIWFYGSSGAPPPRVGRFSAVALNNMALGVFAVAWLMVGLVVRRGGVAVRAGRAGGDVHPGVPGVGGVAGAGVFERGRGPGADAGVG